MVKCDVRELPQLEPTTAHTADTPGQARNGCAHRRRSTFTRGARPCEDPGSKKTGIAIVRETPAAETSLNANGDDVSGPTRTVLFKVEMEHRGVSIRAFEQPGNENW